jgi:anti-sigma B factor antagonist
VADPLTEQPISISMRRPEAGVVVLRVDGELDMLTAPTLEHHIEGCWTQPVGRLVLDLSGVSFLGSSGISVLVGLRRTCVARSCRLTLVCSRVSLRALQASALDQMFVIEPAGESDGPWDQSRRIDF